MMHEKELDQIASLSYLSLKSEDVAKFTGQMNVVLEYMSQLNELDSVIKEEKISSKPICCESQSVTLRKDSVSEREEVENFLLQEGSLHVSKDHYFTVPKVIDPS